MSLPLDRSGAGDRRPRDPRHILVFLRDGWPGAAFRSGSLSVDALQAELSRRGFISHHAITLGDVETALRDWPIGAAVLDLEVPQSELFGAYDLTHATEPALPTILLGSERLQAASRQSAALDRLDEFVRIDQASNSEYILLYLRALLLRANPNWTFASGDRKSEHAGHGLDGTPHELICVFSAKGGTGKTTIAVNVAYALAQERQHEVALIDGDLYFGDVDVNLSLPAGLDGRRRSLNTVVDALHIPSGPWDDQCDIALGNFDQRLLQEILHVHSSGIHVLPAPPRPELAERIHPAVFQRAVELARREFEYTIVDMRSAYSEAEIQLLDVATRIIVVVKPEMSCLRNTTLFLDFASQFGWKDKLLLVLNRADSNRFTKISPEAVEQHLGVQAFPVVSSGMVPQAACEGRTVMQSYPASKVSVSLRGLIDIIDGPLEDERPAQRGLRRLLPGRLSFGKGANVTN